jgi:hypothetical protein
MTDPAIHALWVIRNWTITPRGNMQSAEDILRKVHDLAKEVVRTHHIYTPSPDADMTEWELNNDQPSREG